MSVFVLNCNYVRTAGKEEISRQQKAKKTVRHRWTRIEREGQKANRMGTSSVQYVTIVKEEISRQQKAKKDNQAQVGNKKTNAAEESNEGRAESKKINIKSEFAFILWE